MLLVSVLRFYDRGGAEKEPIEDKVDLCCRQHLNDHNYFHLEILTLEVSERKPLEDSCLPPLEGEVNLN